jgi:hypothetical protein
LNQGIFSGGVRIRSLNGYLIAVNGEVFATTNTGGTTNAFFYKAKTTITSGDPTNGHLIWNNATQISATQLNVSHLTDNPVEDIDLFLSAITSGNKLVVQDRNNSLNYQSWTVSGTPTQVGSTYWTIPVSLIESQGTGTTGFANNHNLLFAIISGGTGGGGITTNAVTFNNSGSGAASGTSFNGATPVTVSYNTFGAQQASASLTSLAGLTYASGTPFVKMTGAGTFALDTNTYLTANQTITLSGNVTGSGTTTISTTIANNVVTNAMLAQIATARIKGRVTAGTGNVEDLTGTQATTLLDTFTSALKGLAPASGGGTTNFLRADGTWAVPAGGGGGTPAGSNTQIQYNNSGAFGASASFAWDNSTQSLNIGNGTAPAYITMLANGASSGWGGRIVADNTTGQFIFQHRNNSPTFITCWSLNANSGIGATYFYDRVFVTNNPGNSAVFIVNSTTDNGVDKLQVSGSVIATTLKVNTSGQTVSISSYYNGGAGKNIWVGGGGLSGTSASEGNTSFGVDALLNNTSGYWNTAIGKDALKSNTSGYVNDAFGLNALIGNTTGYRNVAVGAGSMQANTTGFENMAIGHLSLTSSTTGSKNVAIGAISMTNLTSGSSNIAFGKDAAIKISGGANLTTANQSIFIGEDTRPSADANTNEIVIGHAAIGQGSNSVTLGNSSITQTLLRGTVTGGSFVKSGGTNSQVLYADGSTKQITSGTAAPSGGNDGDIYLQYV